MGGLATGGVTLGLIAGAVGLTLRNEYALGTQAFLLGVIVLQGAVETVTGVRGNEIVTVVSTLAIAALFVPLRNRAQQMIDRRFNRRRFDAQEVLAQFARTVRDETDLEKLSDELVSVVNETLQPKSISLWLKPESTKQLATESTRGPE